MQPDFLRIKRLPEWAVGRHITVFAGNELLAKKESRISHQNGEHTVSYLPLEIKHETGRCSGCSECCETGHSKIILDIMFKALGNYLVEKGEFSNNKPCPFHSNQGCTLGGWIPFSCARSVCSSFTNCTERLEEVK